MTRAENPRRSVPRTARRLRRAAGQAADRVVHLLDALRRRTVSRGRIALCLQDYPHAPLAILAPVREAVDRTWASFYFGTPWNAPAVDAALPCWTPRRWPCLHCGEKIRNGDQGFMRSAISQGPDGKPMSTYRPAHRECDVRMTLGSVDHLERRCSCWGADGDHDTGKSVREEGREVLRWLAARGR